MVSLASPLANLQTSIFSPMCDVFECQHTPSRAHAPHTLNKISSSLLLIWDFVATLIALASSSSFKESSESFH